jgi:hypothetical protein
VRVFSEKIDLVYPLKIDPINNRINDWHEDSFSVTPNLLKILTFVYRKVIHNTPAGKNLLSKILHIHWFYHPETR